MQSHKSNSAWTCASVLNRSVTSDPIDSVDPASDVARKDDRSVFVNNRGIVVYGFTFRHFGIKGDERNTKDDEQILFAGWMSSLVERADGTLYLEGQPSPSEICLLEDLRRQKQKPKRFFGFDTWTGYQSIDGAIKAVHDLAALSRTTTTVVVLLESARDVACSGEAGQHTIMAIDKDGKLWSWAYALATDDEEIVKGKQALRTVKLASMIPQLIVPCESDGNNEVRFKRVWAGDAHFLALAADGRLFSWGSGRFGQLGHGTIQHRLDHPTAIEALEGLRIVDAACGASHSLALSDIGDVYAFGLNSHGQLGIGATTLKHRQQTDDTADSSNTAIPQPVDFYDTGASFTEPLGDVRIVKLACGNAHSAVLDEHGHLYTCGWNKYEQLGHIRHDIPDSVEKDILREQTSSISFFQRIPSDRAWNHIYCGRWTTFVWRITHDRSIRMKKKQQRR